MKRAFDILLSLILVPFLLPLFILIALLIKLTSRGPIIHWSQRIGENNTFFDMPKFRTMYINTPQVATHLLGEGRSYVTPIGKILRKSSLDEIPQLYTILSGKMSFVGPRPALFNQDDLKAMRTEKGVHLLKPGLTGWAQINGRDEIPLDVKVNLDTFYKENQSFKLDLKILLLTFFKIFGDRSVSH